MLAEAQFPGRTERTIFPLQSRVIIRDTGVGRSIVYVADFETAQILTDHFRGARRVTFCSRTENGVTRQLRPVVLTVVSGEAIFLPAGFGERPV